jgi:hypothetical protein
MSPISLKCSAVVSAVVSRAAAAANAGHGKIITAVMHSDLRASIRMTTAYITRDHGYMVMTRRWRPTHFKIQPQMAD